MKVIATKKGFYGKTFLRAGESFEIQSEEQFSAKWMKKEAAPVAKAEVKKVETKKKTAKKKVEKTSDKAVI